MASVMITQRRKRSTTLATVERLWLHQNRKVFLNWFNRVLWQPCPQPEKETALKEAIVRLFPMPVICVTDSLPLALPSLIRFKETDSILLHVA